MRTERTDSGRELIDDQTEERAGADPVEVISSDMNPAETGTANVDGAAGDRTTWVDRRRVLQTLGAVGVVGLAGCLASDDDVEGDGGSNNEGEHMGERSAEFTFLDETYPFSATEVYCENMSGHVAMGGHGDPDLEVRVYDDGDVFVRVTFDGVNGESYRNNRAEGDAGDNVAFDVGGFEGDNAYEEIVEGEEIWVAGTIQAEANSEAAREANPDGGDIEFNISC